MPNKFWAFEEGADDAPNALRLEGVIAEESWWGDEVTPAQFRRDLAAHPGDLVVYINSPGGDVVAGSLIYSMLKEHKGNVTVRIDGLAASAASVVAMAGARVEMAPTAYMMIHNAWTIGIGDKNAFDTLKDQLTEIDRGINLAYQLKTGKTEREVAKLMDAETWMSAAKALEDGFCDAICYTGEDTAGDPATADAAAAAAGTASNAGRNLVAGFAQGIDLPERLPLHIDRGSLPAVAFSPRSQQRAFAQVLKKSLEKPQNNETGQAARARLRLLSM